MVGVALPFVLGEEPAVAQPAGWEAAACGAGARGELTRGPRTGLRAFFFFFRSMARMAVGPGVRVRVGVAPRGVARSPFALPRELHFHLGQSTTACRIRRGSGRREVRQGGGWGEAAAASRGCSVEHGPPRRRASATATELAARHGVGGAGLPAALLAGGDASRALTLAAPLWRGLAEGGAAAGGHCGARRPLHAPPLPLAIAASGPRWLALRFVVAGRRKR